MIAMEPHDMQSECTMYKIRTYMKMYERDDRLNVWKRKRKMFENPHETDVAFSYFKTVAKIIIIFNSISFHLLGIISDADCASKMFAVYDFVISD